jgi:DNA-binding transcriptional LysR family regulator
MAASKRGWLKRTVRPAQLELLAAMDQTQTLTAAARAVGVTQPSASRLLRELEERTGIELFEKFGRTLQPTPSGRVLLQRAARLVADLDRLEEELEAVEKGLIGSVSIGAGVAPCFVLVPRAIADLAQRSSKISVKLKEGGMEELTEELRAGRIDLVVGRIENHHNDLELEALYDPPVKIVCGADHPLSRKRNVPLREAIRGRWLLPEGGTPMRRGIESLFRTEGARPTESLIESSSVQANVALLNACELIWVLSADIATHFANTKQLTILPVPPLPGPGPVLLASLKARTAAEPVKRLQQCLRSAAKGLTQVMQSTGRIAAQR